MSQFCHLNDRSWISFFLHEKQSIASTDNSCYLVFKDWNKLTNYTTWTIESGSQKLLRQEARTINVLHELSMFCETKRLNETYNVGGTCSVVFNVASWYNLVAHISSSMLTSIISRVVRNGDNSFEYSVKAW